MKLVRVIYDEVSSAVPDIPSGRGFAFFLFVAAIVVAVFTIPYLIGKMILWIIFTDRIYMPTFPLVDSTTYRTARSSSSKTTSKRIYMGTGAVTIVGYIIMGACASVVYLILRLR